VFLGAGAVVRPGTGLVLRGHLGYGFASGHFSGKVRLTGSDPTAAAVFAHANELRDLGPLPGPDGLTNTFAALFSEEDYLDPYFASGVRFALPRWNVGPAELTGSATIEHHRSASLEVQDDDDAFRPVRPIEDGVLFAGDVSVGTPPRDVGLEARIDARYGVLDEQGYGAVRLYADAGREALWQSFNVGSSVHVGYLTERAPSQELFLLGGKGTLLGHPYRAFVGDRFWLADAYVSRSVFSPWLSARVFGAAGWTQLRDNRVLPLRWYGTTDAGVRITVGVGAGLLWDIAQADLGRGLDGGEWGFQLSVAKRFRGWL
jgi:hypothetical protein